MDKAEFHRRLKRLASNNATAQATLACFILRDPQLEPTMKTHLNAAEALVDEIDKRLEIQTQRYQSCGPASESGFQFWATFWAKSEDPVLGYEIVQAIKDRDPTLAPFVTEFVQTWEGVKAYLKSRYEKVTDSP